MLIGEMSRRSGVKVPTIRYYERVGLLQTPPRTDGGQRSYGAGHLRRLRFIRHARELGFAVDAIRELLELSVDSERSCEGVDAIARRHLAAVERRIASLSALQIELSRMVATCRHGTVGECRVLEVLADHGLCETGGH